MTMKTKKKLMTIFFIASVALLLLLIGRVTVAQALVRTDTLDDTDPIFNRPGILSFCTRSLAATEVFYDIYPYFHLGGTLIIDMAAAGAGVGTLNDPFLVLYQRSFDPVNPCDNFVASDNNTGVRFDSRIFVNVPPGNYVIVATSNDNDQTGSYQLTITSQWPPLDSLDGTEQTFNRPSVLTSCHLSIFGTEVFYDAFNYYHTGGILTIDMAAAGAGIGTLSNPFLVLYRGSFDPAYPCGGFVASDNNSGTGLDSRIVVNVPRGNYVIVATSSINGQIGFYKLTINTQRPSTNHESAHNLSVNIDPVDTGSVTGNGIECPEDCSESYDEGTMVQLIAVPAAGYVFNHWSGCSSPTNRCDLSMHSDVNLTAHFRVRNRLEVKVLPPDGGQVSGEGIDCPRGCGQEYFTSASVTLTAQPNDGFIFVGWSGRNLEELVCDPQFTVSVEGEVTVYALFSPATGRSRIYRESTDIFYTNWMLYIPILEAPLEGDGMETFWLLCEYVLPGGYFTVVDFGSVPCPIQAEEGAILQMENGTWMLTIPAGDVEFDPGRPYRFTLEVDFTTPDVRLNVIDYGVVQ